MISKITDKRIKDFDYKLFKKYCQELSDYRLMIISQIGNKKYNQVLKLHNKLIKALAERLKIKVLI